MMKQLYTDEMIAKKNKFLKTSNIIISCVLILIVVVLVILFLVSSKEKMMIYFLINSVISILFCWSLLLYINVVIKPIKWKLRYVELMKRSNSVVIQGVIKEVSKDTITVNKLPFKTISIEVHSQDKLLVKSVYLDVDFDFSVGENSLIEFELRNNTISAYHLLGDYYV